MTLRRDFKHMDTYLNELLWDAYPQPPDKGHTQMLREVFHDWIVNVTPCANALDIGCGAVCIAEPFFRKLGIEYTGITLGKEYFYLLNYIPEPVLFFHKNRYTPNKTYPYWDVYI